MDNEEPFIANMSEARAFTRPRQAKIIRFEPENAPFREVGVNVQIMEPGVPNCRYHSQPVQEDFLVLCGECIVILEGEERRLKQWDYVHCPAGTEHVFVGAGDGPSAVLMIGSRRERRAHYPVNEVAARYGASVTEPTDEPEQAYADWRKEPSESIPSPWPLP